MSVTLKDVIIFASGIAIGSTATYFIVKDNFKRKANAEVEDVKKAMENYLDRKGEKPKNSIEDPEVKNEEVTGSERVKSSIVKNLNNKPPITDYAKMYQMKDEEVLESEMVERGVPMALDDDMTAVSPDDDALTEEEESQEQAEYETYLLNEEYKKACDENRPPYEIDASSFDLECSHYQKTDLFYYPDDDVVANELDEDIGSRLLLVGEVIENSHFASDDRQTMYIRNDQLMADYCINKCPGSFTNGVGV